MKRNITLVSTLLAVILASPMIYGTPAKSDPGDGEERVDAVLAPALIGSWVVNVAQGATPPFTALQTFHRGGTVDETSDLLALGGEGPGHGAWERTPDGFAVTFELFIFEPSGAPAGRIRVRETITLTGDRTFTGYSVADLILPDGTLIEKIDGAPITGTRIDVKAVRAEEIGSAGTAFAPRKR